MIFLRQTACRMLTLPRFSTGLAGCALTLFFLCVGSGVYARAGAEELVISAASSLTNAFKAIGEAYEKQYPSAKVLFNFGASDVLMRQIIRGAPADVFASADQSARDRAAAAHMIMASSRHNFTANSLVVIVPADREITAVSLPVLMTARIKRIAYGDPASVPVGRYTEDALKAVGMWDLVRAKSVLAADARQSLMYVAHGEVDAGFVFGTDAAVMPGRVKVAMTVPTPVPITYPIAVVKDSHRTAAAMRFIEFVLSPAGQAALAKYGFQPVVVER